MNYEERQREIDLGERSKIEQPDVPRETEQDTTEYEHCNKCNKLMEYQDYYRNSGLCFTCIMEIK